MINLRTDKKYSIVIPVFNSETSLLELCRVLSEELISLNLNYELIFVDDCSTDNSWGVLKEVCLSYKNIKLIRLGKNVGQLVAVFCGVKKATGDIIITYDDDMQYPVSEISKLISLFCSKDYLMIYGVPLKRKHSLKTKIYALIFRFVINNTIMKHYVPDGYFFSSFRIFNKTFFDNFSTKSDNLRHFDIYAMWVLSPKFLGFFEAQHSPRKIGSSGQTFSKKMNDAIHNWICLFFDYKSFHIMLLTIIIPLLPLFLVLFIVLPTLYFLIISLLIILMGLIAYILTYLSILYVQKNGFTEFFIIEEM